MIAKDTKSSGKHAVILHLFYSDLWPEINGYLNNIPFAFDLYVTLPISSPEHIRQQILEKYPSAQIYSVANRGRDVWPFFELANNVNLLQYQCICKIHSKKSLHLDNGLQWRQDLYSKLLGNSEDIAKIVDLFNNNDALGMIAPAGHVLDFIKYSGNDKLNTLQLAKKLDIPFDDKHSLFIAGGMFWFRPSAIKPLLVAGFTENDFEEEKKQSDGTLAHAIERLFLSVAFRSGYWTLDTDLLHTLIPRAYTQSDFISLLCPDNSAIVTSRYKFVGESSFIWEQAYFNNGVLISKLYKEIYGERPDLQQHFPNPYDTSILHSSYFYWLVKHGLNEYPILRDITHYGYFSNGVDFTSFYWKIYEERLDVQQRFPNPYDTSILHLSYFHWLVTEGAKEYPILREISHYGRFGNGVDFTSFYWKIYEERHDLQQHFPNPYDTSILHSSYFYWLVKHGPKEYPILRDITHYGYFSNGVDFTSFYWKIYEERPDLQHRFPNPYDTNILHLSYFYWLVTEGAKEYTILLEYGRFSNGVDFTSFYWKIYEERPDLQHRFPNPYDTNTLHSSYFYWLVTEGAKEYPILGEITHYGYFSNGVDFTSFYWKIYEERLDVQQRFPNPYDTSILHLSYFYWLVTEGAKEYPILREISHYGRFGNGVDFTSFYWEIYEERPDLQHRFPNPYDTNTLHSSYFYWLVTEGAKEYPILGEITQYGSFSNGADFTATYWKIYQERPDLQHRFPNPYEINDSYSYFQWLNNQGKIEYPKILA